MALIQLPAMDDAVSALIVRTFFIFFYSQFIYLTVLVIFIFILFLENAQLSTEWIQSSSCFLFKEQHLTRQPTIWTALASAICPRSLLVYQCTLWLINKHNQQFNNNYKWTRIKYNVIDNLATSMDKKVVQSPTKK